MKTSEFAAALVVVLVAATAIGGMLYYLKSAPPASTPINQATTNIMQTVQATHSSTPTYSAEGFQETGSVSSVDSAGGHYSIANVALGNPLWITLSANQLAQIQFGEDFEVRLTYAHTGQSMLDTVGKVISVSSNGNCQPIVVGVYSQQPCTTVALLNGNITGAVPSAWNPQVGSEVVFALAPETSTPLVVLTGFQFSAATCNEWSGNQCLNSTATQQFAAFVNNPAPPCLQAGLFSTNGVCVFAAGAKPLSISFSFSNYPFCFGCSYTVLVSATDPGFSVSNIQPNGGGIGSGVTITLSMPGSDYDGILHLTFYFIPS